MDGPRRGADAFDMGDGFEDAKLLQGRQSSGAAEHGPASGWPVFIAKTYGPRRYSNWQAPGALGHHPVRLGTRACKKPLWEETPLWEVA